MSTPGAGQGEVPLQRLAGFQKTKQLRAGQSQHLTLHVKISDLALWDTAHSRNAVTDGQYAFKVGTDASHIVATKNVHVTGALTPNVQYVTVQPERVAYQAGQTIDLTGTNKWLADDTDTAEEPDRDLGIRADKVVEAVNDDQCSSTCARHMPSTRAATRPSRASTVTGWSARSRTASPPSP